MGLETYDQAPGGFLLIAGKEPFGKVSWRDTFHGLLGIIPLWLGVFSTELLDSFVASLFSVVAGLTLSVLILWALARSQAPRL